MKELVLIRHAKSDWGLEGLRDIDRHLNERGYQDAYQLSEWYAKHQTPPELVISSTAIRALSTALIFTRALQLEMDHFKIDQKIYESSLHTLLSVIEELDDSVSSLMLFGHNPSITDLCNHLAGELYFDNISTCGIVTFELHADDWKGVRSGHTTLKYYRYPKEFKNKT